MKVNCADLVTLVTGSLCVEMGRVYELCNGLTGGDLFTHQLVRAGTELQKHARKLFPEVTAFLDKRPIHPGNVDAVVAKTKAKFGDEFDVPPLTDYRHENPVTELADMMKEKS